ncbi:metal ABC transporter permease [Marivirga arenosa]|uniref:Iron chelate uptake ABC transporter family permease subunit n=1 Tax=Marivirga arenosa TaxID=3059076 RepID=A0AA49GE49_9BACT|nr:iron chelate uptake ABC transporter family permease subunit [Marivirga sp. BKB1-2]WKK80992.2 iron chelate uptake ABC transporter family permease subunit [Marivirga sp. BKB1-2]
MWENAISFFEFNDANVIYVSLGTIILGAAAAIVGVFTFFRKKALIGDAIAHSILPGVCLAFILSGTKNYLLLISGAFFTGWLSILAVDYITKKSKIKEDTAIGLILSVFFGVGIMLLTYIQQSGNAAQTGLDSFLFGKAASMLAQDVIIFSAISLVLILMIILFYKELKLITYDKDFAKSIGLPVKWIEFLLSSLTVLAVVTGIQAVGVVLMAALLITPTAAAKYWSGSLSLIMILAAIIGGFSGVSGAFISYIAPNMPTGPWVVMVLSISAIISIMFAPKKGYISRLWQQTKNRRQIQDENILKAFHQIAEKEESFGEPKSIEKLREKRYYAIKLMKRILARLKRQGYLNKTSKGYYLSDYGQRKAARLVKLHRLWELYLTEYLRIAPDHVHEDADTIEHLITPELEKRLEEKLGYPEVDPHNSKIPYN